MPDNPFEPMIKNIGDYVSGTLYAQGVIPPIGIDNYEGLALASPADVHLLAAKDPVIDEIAVGMTGNLITGKTVSGVPPLQLPNSAGYPLQYWNVTLSPYQEGTGDPSPDNIRPIHGTHKLNLYVEESYDPSATPKAIINVPPLSANQWDEVWEVGKISTTTGGNITGNNEIRSKNYIPVQPSTEYAVVVGGTTWLAIETYKADKTFLENLGSVSNGRTFTTAADCHYVRFYTAQTYGTAYLYDIAINYPSTVTTYNPYNNTVYNGSIDTYGGFIRWGEVDLGTQNWTVASSYGEDIFQTVISGKANGVLNIMCTNYATTAQSTANMPNNTIKGHNGNTRIYVRDSRYSDPAIFKTAVTGVKLIYELVTPTTFAVTAPNIPTPSDTATTWATAEDGTVDSMEVGYIENT